MTEKKVNMKGIGPVLFQRGCRVEYVVRDKSGPRNVINKSLEVAAVHARAEQRSRDKRMWVDLVIVYSGAPGNSEAGTVTRPGRTTVGSFEIFEDDVVLCPAGARKLDPKWYARIGEIHQEEQVAR